MQQLIAVLAGRQLEPQPAGAKKTALISEPEQIGSLPKGEMQPAETTATPKRGNFF